MRGAWPLDVRSRLTPSSRIWAANSGLASIDLRRLSLASWMCLARETPGCDLGDSMSLRLRCADRSLLVPPVRFVECADLRKGASGAHCRLDIHDVPRRVLSLLPAYN